MTDAELVAWNIGVRTASDTRAEWVPGSMVTVDPTPSSPTSDEAEALRRLGPGAFAYWALRGALDGIDALAP